MRHEEDKPEIYWWLGRITTNIFLSFLSRLKNLGDSVDSLEKYTNGYAEEEQFVAQTQTRINTQAAVNGDVEQSKKLLGPAMVRLLVKILSLYTFKHKVSVI